MTGDLCTRNPEANPYTPNQYSSYGYNNKILAGLLASLSWDHRLS